MSVRHVSLIALAVVVSASSLFAQDDQAKKKAAVERKKATQAKREAAKGQRLTSKNAARAKMEAARKPALTTEQQNAAMAFARENHPELVPLINSLRKSRKADYNRALRDLHMATTRFGRLRERLPGDRYEQQLTIWKLDSRIKLQLAKWSVSKGKKLEADIRDSIAQRNAIRRQQLEQEVLRAKERLAKLEAAFAKASESKVDAEWERLSKSVKRRNSGQKKQSERKKKFKAKDSEPENP